VKARRSEGVKLFSSVTLHNRRGRINVIGTKYVPVTLEMFQIAFKSVKANRGSAGIDKESIKDFEQGLEDNLYKLWNRMASGSYFPPAVREAEIPKEDGKMRKLGIPTVSDRVAQTVIKSYIEPRFEAIFSNSSYGYRPKRSAHQALAQVRQDCWRTDWVIDLDIKGFFDNIDHKLLMLAIDKHVPEKWVKMYIRRWLEMPIVTVKGETIYKEGKGTPQGGVISPLLANVFLHYVFDKWMEVNYPYNRFARYADDVVVHCPTKENAEKVLDAIRERMLQCKLELHPEKTKIVYCKDTNRMKEEDNIQFDFLGYTFQPRDSKSSRGIFISFDCAISKKKRTKIKDALRSTRFHRATDLTIEELAKALNPRIQGWLNYYGKFRRFEMRGVFSCLNRRLAQWVNNKYKDLNWHQSFDWLRLQFISHPKLFAHWRVGFIGT
jgi:RNA-directed DNA polymerase